jgi:hypothetical protein
LSTGEIETKETDKAKSISENPLATTIEILSSVSNAKPNANTDQSNKPLVNTEQNVKETMSTTMHLFTFYLESDGMSTNNDYKHFFGALSLQFC